MERNARWLSVESPLPTGPIHVAVTDRGVVGTQFWHEGLPGESCAAGDERAATVAARFAEYFAGARQTLELPLDWSWTEGLQRTVLQTLETEVGYGRTITYGGLATRSGAFENELEAHLAARAVGQIMGSNPLFLLVPCHRVVAADGLGGFGGGELGMAVKRWLLTLEGVLQPTLDWDGPG